MEIIYCASVDTSLRKFLRQIGTKNIFNKSISRKKKMDDDG